MHDEQFWSQVEAVFRLVRVHSEENKATRRPVEDGPAWAGRLSTLGVLVFAAALAAVPFAKSWPFQPKVAIVVALALSVVAMLVGLAFELIHAARTTRAPFAEHVDRIASALPQERVLLAALARFDVDVLAFARQRMELETTKVVTRLDLFGSGEGIKPSWIGVAALGGALITQYEPVVNGWSLKLLGYFGVALILGGSVAALFLRHGTTRAQYYCDLIALAELRKQSAKKNDTELSGTDDG